MGPTEINYIYLGASYENNAKNQEHEMEFS